MHVTPPNFGVRKIAFFFWKKKEFGSGAQFFPSKIDAFFVHINLREQTNVTGREQWNYLIGNIRMCLRKECRSFFFLLLNWKSFWKVRGGKEKGKNFQRTQLKRERKISFLFAVINIFFLSDLFRCVLKTFIYFQIQLRPPQHSFNATLVFIVLFRKRSFSLISEIIFVRGGRKYLNLSYTRK